MLMPGHHVGREHVKLANGREIKGNDFVGIIDPMLKSPIYPEQGCWLCIYPGTVISLRHTWRHPAFTTTLEIPYET